jgi:tetratricopeptide (TPR) repeat protein
MTVGNGIALAVAVFLAASSARSQGMLEEAGRQTWRCEDPHRAPKDRVDGCRWLAQYEPSEANRATLANVLRLTGDYDGALAALGHVDDRLTTMLLTRGEIYATKGDYAPAVADGDRIVVLYPELYASYTDRCWIRAIANRDLDQAAADCNKALGLAPDDSTTLDGLGLIAFRRGDLKSAISDFSAALDGHPNLSWAFYMRGVAKCGLGVAGSGEADISRAKARQPYVAADPASYGIPEPACASK